MALDRDTVRRIAHLARIRVADADLEPLAADLDGILGWVEQLSEVDTDGVEPMTSVVATAWTRRPDVVADGGEVDKVLANAPEVEDHFFVVPKVVE